MSSPWERVKRCDPRALAVVDGTGNFSAHGKHYSRQTPGAAEFMPPGATFVLLGSDGKAVWGAVENRFRGQVRWRVTVFRNTGGRLSSLLVRKATRLTRAHWRNGRGTPGPLRTEVDPSAVRRKRDPGRCFLRAGWKIVGKTRGGRHRGALVLEAP